MRTSQQGISLIRAFEGVKLTAYQDGGGIWTIGYGHTGPEVKAGLKITMDTALEYLAADLRKAEAGVSRWAGTRVSQCQFDALVAFVFNLGATRLRDSTLLRRLLAGDTAGAADQFLRWVYDNGIRVAGLVRRREAERELFLGKGYPARK